MNWKILQHELESKGVVPLQFKSLPKDVSLFITSVDLAEDGFVIHYSLRQGKAERKFKNFPSLITFFQEKGILDSTFKAENDIFICLDPEADPMKYYDFLAKIANESKGINPDKPKKTKRSKQPSTIMDDVTPDVKSKKKKTTKSVSFLNHPDKSVGKDDDISEESPASDQKQSDKVMNKGESINFLMPIEPKKKRKSRPTKDKQPSKKPSKKTVTIVTDQHDMEDDGSNQSSITEESPSSSISKQSSEDNTDDTNEQQDTVQIEHLESAQEDMNYLVNGWKSIMSGALGEMVEEKLIKSEHMDLINRIFMKHFFSK